LQAKWRSAQEVIKKTQNLKAAEIQNILTVLSIFDQSGVTNIIKATIAPICDFSLDLKNDDLNRYGAEISQVRLPAKKR